jgi:predicted ATP-dependent Lon-type protease
MSTNKKRIPWYLQAKKSTLFYKKQRQKIVIVRFLDTVAFDELGGISVNTPTQFVS